MPAGGGDRLGREYRDMERIRAPGAPRHGDRAREARDVGGTENVGPGEEEEQARPGRQSYSGILPRCHRREGLQHIL